MSQPSPITMDEIRVMLVEEFTRISQGSIEEREAALELAATWSAVACQNAIEIAQLGARLIRFAKDVDILAHHGPEGRGGLGACHPHCPKCQAQEILLNG